MSLLKSEGYNIIIICVNNLIKIKHFIPIINKITAQGTVYLFIERVYKHYKLPKIIVSD